MPCNIGYKNYSRIEIPQPQPQKFEVKAEAPNIDSDLLDKLGEEDPEFLEWAKELDTKPLLEEALKRALKAIAPKDLDFVVDEKGMLQAKGKFFNANEKKLLSQAAARVSSRWQFEILGIVAELLDYNVTVRESNGGLVLEAEEEGASHPCDFIKVTKDGNNAELTFEHFKTRKALTLEMAKFLTLADRLGVKIALRESAVSEGDPFPDAVQHVHKHKHAH